MAMPFFIRYVKRTAVKEAGHNVKRRIMRARITKTPNRRPYQTGRTDRTLVKSALENTLLVQSLL